MSETPAELASPAYIAYSTFKNKIRGLAPNGKLPSRIDRSALAEMSGAGQSQFLGALRFFDLIDGEGNHDERLKKLATANEEEWNQYLEKLIAEKYADHLEALAHGTPQQLKESFGNIGASIYKPAKRFLVTAADAVGIEVSHLHKKKSSNGNSTASRKTPLQRKPSPRTKNTEALAESPTTILLRKFPEFNAQWDEKRQQSWFDAYQNLLEITEKREVQNDG
jgi:hypothetical protein